MINEWIIRVLCTFLRPVLDQLIKRTREGARGISCFTMLSKREGF